MSVTPDVIARPARFGFASGAGKRLLLAAAFFALMVVAAFAVEHVNANAHSRINIVIESTAPIRSWQVRADDAELTGNSTTTSWTGSVSSETSQLDVTSESSSTSAFALRISLDDGIVSEVGHQVKNDHAQRQELAWGQGSARARIHLHETNDHD